MTGRSAFVVFWTHVAYFGLIPSRPPPPPPIRKGIIKTETAYRFDRIGTRPIFKKIMHQDQIVVFFYRCLC